MSPRCTLPRLMEKMMNELFSKEGLKLTIYGLLIVSAFTVWLIVGFYLAGEYGAWVVIPTVGVPFLPLIWAIATIEIRKEQTRNEFLERISKEFHKD